MLSDYWSIKKLKYYWFVSLFNIFKSNYSGFYPKNKSSSYSSESN